MMVSAVVDKRAVRNLLYSWISMDEGIHLVNFALTERKYYAIVEARAQGILAGSPIIDLLFKEFECDVEWHVCEGDVVENGVKVATITGRCTDLMSCEKLAVAIMSRASGIASYAKKMRKVLSDTQWKGDLCVPPSLTPGFQLVEKYAMLLSGLTFNKPAASIRQCHANAAGGIEKVIKTVRSKVGMQSTIEVECADLADAFSASKAGANLISFSQPSLKELTTIVTQLKKSHPQVLVQVTGTFDDCNVKTYALTNVDYLCSSKLTNGYPPIHFHVAYVPVPQNSEESSEDKIPKKGTVVNPPETKSNSQSSGPQPDGEVTGSPAPASKKSRLDSSESDSPSQQSKQNGTPSRSPNQPSPSWQSGANAVKEQNQKRLPRNQRPQHTLQQRPNVTRSQSGNAVPLFQMSSPRFPNSSPRGQLNQLQTTNVNQLSSVLGSQNIPNPGFRLSGQHTPRMSPGQQINPGMLGSSPNMGAGFLNMQSHQQSNWPMMTGGTGPVMGGIGVGMRMGGPGGMSNCRSCGAAVAPGLPFCRNCRSPLR